MSDARPRADAAALLAFFEVVTGDAFALAPEKAIAYFKAKGLVPTFSYADMLGAAHDHGFTVAKMMNVDMLGQVRSSLDSAMANGTPFKEWADGIIPLLQSGGWWGRKEVLDPLTGQPMIAQLGSPWRLETIFRTNVQSAYAAGQWQEIDAQAADAPYLMYDAVDDLRTRPMHASWDRKVLPVDSGWWNTHYPPNGWNCRCGVIQLSEDELSGLGLTPATAPPSDGTYTWSNPRTGEKEKIPNGLDPGFDHNAGKSYLTDLNKLLTEKIDALPGDMEAAAKTAAQQSVADALKALSAAKLVKAEAEAAAAQAAAKKLIAEQEANAAAAAQLKVIAGGAKGEIGVGAGYLIKALDTLGKAPGWAGLKAVDKLDLVTAKAAEFKLKTETASKLATYKKAVLEGKIPAPSLVKALKSLPEAEQAAFLAKVDAEVAAAKGAQAAAKAAEEAAAAKAKQAAQDAAKAAQAAQEAQAAALAQATAKATAKAALAAKKATAAAAKAEAAATTAPVAPGAPNPSKLVKIGEQRGSNPGGTYQDTETGVKWYIKQPASVEVARNELLAGKFYEAAGVEVPEMHIITLDGKPSLASRIVDGLESTTGPKLAKLPGAQDYFAIDAWLANWDVVGMGFDNMLVKAGRAFRVDTGGALRYRAQGTLKGDAFGRSVTEIDSMRSATNRQTQAVFGSMSQEELEASVLRVLRISEADIRALVAKHGPTRAADQALLADTLIARQRDLADRYPKAAAKLKAPDKPAPTDTGRITKAEHDLIVASRSNGYGIATDGDQIEDNMVLVHTFTSAKKAPVTRGFLKLTPKASKELEALIESTDVSRAKPTADGGPAVDLREAKANILSAVKSVQDKADKGIAWPQVTKTKVDSATTSIMEAVKDIDKALAVAVDGRKQLEEVKATLLEWYSHFTTVEGKAGAGIIKGQAFPKQWPHEEVAYELKYKLKAATAAKVEDQIPAIGKWAEGGDDWKFATSTGAKGAHIEGTGQSRVSVGRHYIGELPGGIRVKYAPAVEGVPLAMRGVLQIDLDGNDLAASEGVFKALDSLKISATRSTPTDRQILYLNSFARLRLTGDSLNSTAQLKQYQQIDSTGEKGVKDRLKFLKDKTGVDIEASAGWKSVDGQREGFGHGVARQYRPDLDTPEFAAFERAGHQVYHNPNGLGHNGGRNVFAAVQAMIESGGNAVSLVERARRGIAISGTTSGESDLRSGGGAYYFTRILKNNTGTGLYWKPGALKRMDAISYESDAFGKTSAEYLIRNRRGGTVASFTRTAQGSANETIFKGGLSLFQDLDSIVLDSQVEVESAIAWLKGQGYAQWPDGRPLADVIITSAKKRARKP